MKPSFKDAERCLDLNYVSVLFKMLIASERIKWNLKETNRACSLSFLEEENLGN